MIGTAINSAPIALLGWCRNSKSVAGTRVDPATSASPSRASNGRTPPGSQRKAPWSKNRELGTEIQPTVSTPSTTTSQPWATEGEAQPMASAAIIHSSVPCQKLSGRLKI